MNTVLTVKSYRLDLVTSPDKKYPALAATLFRIHSVFQNFHSGERIQKVADSYAGFTGYVWTEALSGKEKLRVKKYSDTYRQGLVKQEIASNTIVTVPYSLRLQNFIMATIFLFKNYKFVRKTRYSLYYVVSPREKYPC